MWPVGVDFTVVCLWPMGVDLGAVFCGLWGWISRLCSLACGGGFRGCVMWPVVVDFAACGGGFCGCVLWPVGVDFAAVVFVLEPGFEQLKESNPGSKPGIRKPGFFRVEPGPDPDGKKSGLMRVRGNASPDPVLDIAGKQLRAGSKYYILPVTKGRGVGLTLAGRSNNKTCPLDVVQEQHSFRNGLPVTFSPVNPKKGVVRESTDLNIKFDAATSCAQSTVWKLDNFDTAFGQWLVTTGGVEGNPGPRTMRNWFKIEKFYGDYKLVFCPSVCNFCRGLCRDVGIFINGGVRRLALSDVPLKVVFKKV
ncbi:Kunitz trypsin inhibitor 5 [Citrus sinensis]|uniref:Kunitz trypsin inhibitor 5 n=1 Tax=Citrus sinensis TaxID=2711 RepID=A0ACB8M5S8_CITSI|nr:Kunitz trypsin inhibitor 5 [Citrus sinensis]